MTSKRHCLRPLGLVIRGKRQPYSIQEQTFVNESLSVLTAHTQETNRSKAETMQKYSGTFVRQPRVYCRSDVRATACPLLLSAADRAGHTLRRGSCCHRHGSMDRLQCQSRRQHSSGVASQTPHDRCRTHGITGPCVRAFRPSSSAGRCPRRNRWCQGDTALPTPPSRGSPPMKSMGAWCRAVFQSVSFRV